MVCVHYWVQFNKHTEWEDLGLKVLVSVTHDTCLPSSLLCLTFPFPPAYRPYSFSHRVTSFQCPSQVCISYSPLPPLTSDQQALCACIIAGAGLSISSTSSNFICTPIHHCQANFPKISFYSCHNSFRTIQRLPITYESISQIMVPRILEFHKILTCFRFFF